MFGIGLPELFIILVIALVVLGPDKLPSLARAIGRGIGEFRKAADELKGSIQSDEELSQLADSLSQAKSEMTDIMREQTKDLDVDGVVSSLSDGTFLSGDEKTDEAADAEVATEESEIEGPDSAEPSGAAEIAGTEPAETPGDTETDDDEPAGPSS